MADFDHFFLPNGGKWGARAFDWGKMPPPPLMLPLWRAGILGPGQSLSPLAAPSFWKIWLRPWMAITISWGQNTFQCFSGDCTPNLNSASFVPYHKIINTFVKHIGPYNISIMKQNCPRNSTMTLNFKSVTWFLSYWSKYANYCFGQ